MLTLAKKYRIEIKYIIIAIIVMTAFVALAQTESYGAIETGIEDFVDSMTELGLVGVFLVALIANASLLIQVPYTLPMLSVALYSHTLLDLLILGIATGMGAGIGEIISYGIAYNIAQQIRELQKSGLFRWIRSTIDRHPTSIPIFVFLGAVTPIPDDLIIMPLAMINYPIRKLLVPMFFGKIVHNFTVALLFHYATGKFADRMNGDVNVDLSLSILIGFVLIILYQVEKAGLMNGKQTTEEVTEITDDTSPITPLSSDS